MIETMKKDLAREIVYESWINHLLKKKIEEYENVIHAKTEAIKLNNMSLLHIENQLEVIICEYDRSSKHLCAGLIFSDRWGATAKEASSKALKMFSFFTNESEILEQQTDELESQNEKAKLGKYLCLYRLNHRQQKNIATRILSYVSD